MDECSPCLLDSKAHVDNHPVFAPVIRAALRAGRERDEAGALVELGKHCSPRHRVPFNSANEGSPCVA